MPYEVFNAYCIVIDATQVMSELEFATFFQKHKADRIWKEMQYIQMFMKPKVAPFSSSYPLLNYH